LSGEPFTLCSFQWAGPAEKLEQAEAPAERDAGDVLINQGELGPDEAEGTSHLDVGCRTAQSVRDPIHLPIDAVDERRLVSTVDEESFDAGAEQAARASDLEPTGWHAERSDGLLPCISSGAERWRNISMTTPSRLWSGWTRANDQSLISPSFSSS
jgi:hypothetical protein